VRFRVVLNKHAGLAGRSVFCGDSDIFPNIAFVGTVDTAFRWSTAIH
jgi:hypothetical protein